LDDRDRAVLGCKTHIVRGDNRYTLDDYEHDAVFVFLDLVVNLRAHATRDRAGEEVRDQVHNFGKIFHGVNKDGDNIQNAAEALQAIGACDELVVARVRANSLGIHKVEPCNGDRKDRTAKALTAETKWRANTTLGRVDATARWNIALAASVIINSVVVLVEHCFAGPACREPKGSAHG